LKEHKNTEVSITGHSYFEYWHSTICPFTSRSGRCLELPI